MRDVPELTELSEQDVDPDPIAQFSRWYFDARAVHGDDADAMVVATVDGTGAPSARVVLLRGFDERGFCFFTSYGSRKGRELATNPRAALVWYWAALHRQVRVTGGVTTLTGSESDAYWYQRPLESRLSAWASHQSEPVADRGELEAAVVEVAARFGDEPVRRPDFWGGYLVEPDEFEFWLHRDDRLHDRIRYRPSGDGWAIERLQP
jgi:pyridoxamine 5'-phosphate oxidase